MIRYKVEHASVTVKARRMELRMRITLLKKEQNDEEIK